MNQGKMVSHKVLLIVVLCCVHIGAAKDVLGTSCGFLSNQGTCTTATMCPPGRVMGYKLGGIFKGCHKTVTDHHKLVCCLNQYKRVNLLGGGLYYFNYLNNLYNNFNSGHRNHNNGATVGPRPTTSRVPSIAPTIPSTTSSSTTTTPRPVATTPRLGTTTTEYMPPEYDYVTNEPRPPECREIDPKLTTAKTGQPAWDKCIEYQEQLVYPCVRSVALLGNKVRTNRCSHAGEAAEDGVARPDEFPHMVVLGYRGRLDDPLQWACTGTLISEWFILTPAHCWANSDDSDTLYATLGNDQRNAGNPEPYQEHKIQSKLFYGRERGLMRTQDGRLFLHDIALLKTATEIRLSQWVVPACLDMFGRDTEAVATRWRTNSWHTTNSVQKTYLHQLGWKEYQTKFNSSNRRRNYLLEYQMGFATRYNPNDNCQFDKEVSLTVENKWVHCMHTVVGLPSNANATCGQSPANSFTKVYEYRSWIEQNVWPKNGAS